MKRALITLILIPFLGVTQVKQFNNIKCNGDTIFGVTDTIDISNLVNDTSLFNRTNGTITPKSATDTLDINTINTDVIYSTDVMSLISEADEITINASLYFDNTSRSLLWGNNALYPNPSATAKAWVLPDTTGTIALTSDVFWDRIGGTITPKVSTDTLDINTINSEVINLSDTLFTGAGDFMNTSASGAMELTSDKGISLINNTGSLSVTASRLLFTDNGSGYLDVQPNNNRISLSDNSTNVGSLVFPSSTNSWTLPESTGTIALTSDLSAYLPLTGGTITNNLTIQDTLFLESLTEDTDPSKVLTIDGDTTKYVEAVYLDSITGNIGNEITPVDTIHVDRLKVYSMPHLFCYFPTQTTSFTFASTQTWYHVTNATNDLFTCECDGFTTSNDTIVSLSSGDFDGQMQINFTAQININYRMRLYNVTQAIAYPIGGANSGAGSDYRSIVALCYLEDLQAGDELVLQLMNDDGTQTLTLKSGVIKINYLHE